MGKIKREDRIVVKALRVAKNWSSRRFLKEFASKAFTDSSKQSGDRAGVARTVTEVH